MEGGRPPFHVHEDSLTHSRSQQAQSVARDSKKCVVYDRPSQIYSFADGEPRDANQTPIKNAVGATEAIAYSYDYVDALLKANVDVPGYMVVQILRFISLPFLHAIWCGTSAYFLALAVASQTSQRMLPVIGVATVALLHGSYNTFSDSWIGFAVSVLSMFVFVGYVRTGAAQAIRSDDPLSPSME